MNFKQRMIRKTFKEMHISFVLYRFFSLMTMQRNPTGYFVVYNRILKINTKHVIFIWRRCKTSLNCKCIFISLFVPQVLYCMMLTSLFLFWTIFISYVFSICNLIVPTQFDELIWLLWNKYNSYTIFSAFYFEMMTILFTWHQTLIDNIDFL